MSPGVNIPNVRKKHPPGSHWVESLQSGGSCCSYSHLCSFNKLHRDTHTAAAAAAVSTPQPKAEQTHHHVECDHGASLTHIFWDVKWNTDDFTPNAPILFKGCITLLKIIWFMKAYFWIEDDCWIIFHQSLACSLLLHCLVHQQRHTSLKGAICNDDYKLSL